MEIGRCMRSLDFSQSYLDKKIGWAKLTEILDSIRYAPSAGDLQNWKLVVVKEEETKKEIAKVAANQLWMAKADVLVIVCNDQSEAKRMFKEKADFYSTQSCAAGIQNILLKANSIGVDSSWVRTFNADRIRSILKIPEDIKIDAIITLGFAKKKEKTSRKNELRNITYFEEWGKSESKSS